MYQEEEHRHRSEVREWIRRGRGQTKDWMVKVFADIAKKRGRAASERLYRDVVQQAKKGNDGSFGTWKE